MKYLICAFFLLFSFCSVANAQEKEVVEDGSHYVLHTVKKGETLFSVSQAYHIEQKDLVNANPDLKFGLKTGQQVRIPVPGNKYAIHKVSREETLYSISKQYQCSIDTIIKLNPEVKNGLWVGMKLKIPKKDSPAFSSEGSVVRYTVKKGETLFNVSSRFKTSISELQTLNPFLNSRGLISGETILVPGPDGEGNSEENGAENTEGNQVTATLLQEQTNDVKTYPEPVSGDCQPDKIAASRFYHVGLLLPLYLPANDTINRIRVTAEEMFQDTTSFVDKAVSDLPADSFRVRKNAVVYPKSENFLNFYEGVLLAADSLKNAGMHIDLYVFDTNQSPHVVDSLLHLEIFKKLDLIIGPVFPELQKPVADFAYRNHIPFVSPLSSSGNLEETNPYYFKINPTRKCIIRETADYISREYSGKNLIILKMGEYRHLPEAELVNMVKSNYYSSNLQPGTATGTLHEFNYPEGGLDGLKSILSEDTENVFIIPSEAEGQVSVAVTNLNAVAEDFPVTLVGLSNFQKYKSIQTEYFHHEKLNFLSPYFVDYKSRLVNQFIRKYRHDYFAEPDQFSFQGYDVAFYFLSALFNYGKDFYGCLPSLKVDLMQGDFSFKRVGTNGGYMNGGLFILKYTPDYRIERKGVTGK